MSPRSLHQNNRLLGILDFVSAHDPMTVDEILDQLVECVSEMQVPVCVWRSVMKYK